MLPCLPAGIVRVVRIAHHQLTHSDDPAAAGHGYLQISKEGRFRPRSATMNANLTRIHKGWTVYGSDEQEVGKVLAVRGLPPSEMERPIIPPNAGANPDATAASNAASVNDPGVRATGLDTGTLPLGVTEDKDRGAPTGLSAVAHRGDSKTLTDLPASARPGAGGLDVMRGYSPGSAGVTGAEGSALSATDSLDGGGTTRMLSGSLRAGEVERDLDADRERAPAGTAPRAGDSSALNETEPYLLVQDPGVLGVTAAGLHIPLSAGRDASTEGRVMLDCPREEAHLRYGRRALTIDESADVTPF
jgi:hypothetical protein